MKIDSIKTGNQLKDWRYSKKEIITREEVAAMTHYSYSQVCRMEQKNQYLPPKFIEALKANYK